jgi:hypothetical protein
LNKRSLHLQQLLWSLAACVVWAGCGGAGGNANVTGKVSYSGMPVTGGALLLVPNGGQAKSIEAEVQPDGTFRSTTAMAGNYTATYSPPTGPSPLDLQPGESAPPGPFDGLVPKQPEVEIKSGANTLDVELVKPAPPAA